MIQPDELPGILSALDHPQRLRIIAALRVERQYVSALARQLGISRPLLYLHLDRLEKAGLVTGHLELGEGGRAVKWFQAEPFEVLLNVDEVARAADALPPRTPGSEPPDEQS